MRGANLAGDGPRALALVDAVGHDLVRKPGTCGKNGQAIPVTTGAPTIRVARVTVGGVG